MTLDGPSQTVTGLCLIDVSVQVITVILLFQSGIIGIVIHNLKVLVGLSIHVEKEEVVKYQENLHDSDDSIDEEVLLRTGDVP